MKYKHRRRVVKYRKSRKDVVKKFFRLLVILTAIWFALFQGTLWSAGNSSPSITPEEPKEIPEITTSSSEVMFGFFLFLCLLYNLHHLLNWWFYEREDYLGNVRMLTDEERKELQAREKIK